MKKILKKKKVRNKTVNAEKEYIAKEGVRLSSPWVEYYNQLEALFGQDPDIKLEYNEDDYKIKIFVHGHDKAEALQKLIPAEKSWGGVKLTIIIVPDNESCTSADIVRKAFEGNPLYDQTIVIRPDGTLNPFGYVCFKKEVLQYWNDNLADPHGNVSTLAENVAREILNVQDGIFYCTSPD